MNNRNDFGGESATQRNFYLPALICGAVVFIVYLGALKSGFVNWDDNSLVYSNPNIRSLDLAFIKWAFTDVAIASWYPLTVISLAIDYAVWGLNPLGYHLTNNLFHAVNTALVFLLVSRLFLYSTGNSEKSEGVSGTANMRRGAFACALVTALFFGLHPLRVESVAWVSERKDVLYAFFYLLSLIIYCAYRRSALMDGGARQRLLYILSLALFVFSLMSKAMAVTLPLVLVIIDLYIFKAHSGGFKFVPFIRDKVPFFILSIVFSILTVFTHGESGTLVSLDVHSPLVRLLFTFREYTFYMVKTIIPTGLAPFYPLPSSISVFSVEYLGSFILFAAITALSIYLIKKRGWLAACWAYYVVTLLPVTGFFRIGAHAGGDRYTYLPVLGLLIVPGLIIGALFMRPGIRNIKALAAIVSAVVLVLFGALTLKQIAVWKDSVTLWNYEISIYPDNVPVAYINLGNAYDDLSLTDDAMLAYKKALDIDPKNAVAHNNLGFLYQERAFFDLALEHYSAALLDATRPAYIARILENMGDVLLASGRGAQAAKRYQRALEVEGVSLKEANLLNKLGIALARSGQMEEARESFQRALELNPAHVGARENLLRVEAE